MNAMDPMGEDLVHDNAVDPIITDRLQCAYCGMHFQSRNRLFAHLRENGIDTGVITKRKRSGARWDRKRYFKRLRSAWYPQKRMKRNTRRKANDLAEIMEQVNITDNFVCMY
jgi:hypothetical protein